VAPPILADPPPREGERGDKLIHAASRLGRKGGSRSMASGRGSMVRTGEGEGAREWIRAEAAAVQENEERSTEGLGLGLEEARRYPATMRSEIFDTRLNNQRWHQIFRTALNFPNTSPDR
jgi:hypothetical protein